MNKKKTSFNAWDDVHEEYEQRRNVQLKPIREIKKAINNNQKNILKTKYNVQYDYSQLANEIREKDAKASGNKYRYYKFKNKDGSYVYFPGYNVNILHHPSINKVIYNVSLYEFKNKQTYVMVYYFDNGLNNAPRKIKYSVSEFYDKYKNYILFDK